MEHVGGAEIARSGGKSIPVYLAAAGPRTTRLAGKVADGLLMAGTFEPQRWQQARELVAEGAKRAGRNESSVAFCLSLLTCIRPTREEALRDAGPMLALRLDQPEWLAAHGIDAGGLRTPQALHDLYPDPMHTEDQEAALTAAETVPLELRAQIADVLGIIGTPDYAIERLKQVAGVGISEVFLRTVNTLSFPEGEMAAYGESMASAVRSLRGLRRSCSLCLAVASDPSCPVRHPHAFASSLGQSRLLLPQRGPSVLSQRFASMILPSLRIPTGLLRSRCGGELNLGGTPPKPTAHGLLPLPPLDRFDFACVFVIHHTSCLPGRGDSALRSRSAGAFVSGQPEPTGPKSYRCRIAYRRRCIIAEPILRHRISHPKGRKARYVALEAWSLFNPNHSCVLDSAGVTSGLGG